MKQTTTLCQLGWLLEDKGKKKRKKKQTQMKKKSA
jgi:hypothetical protein